MTKWTGIWAERYPRTRLDVAEVAEKDQRRVLVDDEVDLCFVRLPIDVEGLHLIRLYEELPVAWVAKDHLLAAADELVLADLADLDVFTEVTPRAIDLASIGEAVFHVPQSIARTYSRRDFVAVPISDAPTTAVGLAWRVDNPHEFIEDFIGVVRGRTVNSSRTARSRAEKATSPAPGPVVRKQQRGAVRKTRRSRP